jgi:hypothetical protein
LSQPRERRREGKSDARLEMTSAKNDPLFLNSSAFHHFYFCPGHQTISNHVMEISGDEIADAVLREFERWPKKRKPLARSDGVKEWVSLSGIVAQS